MWECKVMVDRKTVAFIWEMKPLAIEIPLFLFPSAIFPADSIDRHQPSVRNPGGWSL